MYIFAYIYTVYVYIYICIHINTYIYIYIYIYHVLHLTCYTVENIVLHKDGERGRQSRNVTRTLKPEYSDIKSV